MAEGMKVLTANTAHAFGGSQLSLSLRDVLEPKKVDTRSAEEIKEHMKKILGDSSEEVEHERI